MTTCPNRSASCLCAALAVCLSAVAPPSASADIVLLSRASHIFSQRFVDFTVQPPESASTTTFDPFNAAVTGASQNTTVSTTTFGGTVNNNPFALSTQMHPASMTASSDFTLNFRVDFPTDFSLTGNIHFEQMTGVFTLTGPGNVLLFTPTYTPSGSPFGGQVATLNYHTVLPVGDYTLTVSTSGNSNGAGSPTTGQISFQVNAAPTPAAGALLGLGACLTTTRRRRTPAPAPAPAPRYCV